MEPSMNDMNGPGLETVWEYMYTYPVTWNLVAIVLFGYMYTLHLPPTPLLWLYSYCHIKMLAT